MDKEDYNEIIERFQAHIPDYDIHIKDWSTGEIIDSYNTQLVYPYYFEKLLIHYSNTVYRSRLYDFELSDLDHIHNEFLLDMFGPAIRDVRGGIYNIYIIECLIQDNIITNPEIYNGLFYVENYKFSPEITKMIHRTQNLNKIMK